MDNNKPLKEEDIDAFFNKALNEADDETFDINAAWSNFERNLTPPASNPISRLSELKNLPSLIKTSAVISSITIVSIFIFQLNKNNDEANAKENNEANEIVYKERTDKNIVQAEIEVKQESKPSLSQERKIEDKKNQNREPNPSLDIPTILDTSDNSITTKEEIKMEIPNDSIHSINSNHPDTLDFREKMIEKAKAKSKPIFVKPK